MEPWLKAEVYSQCLWREGDAVERIWTTHQMERCGGIGMLDQE